MQANALGKSGTLAALVSSRNLTSTCVTVYIYGSFAIFGFLLEQGLLDLLSWLYIYKKVHTFGVCCAC